MNSAVPATAAAESTATPAIGKLINIDNGGTLTDICVIDGPQVYRTKTITTPYDLSKCLFEGLSKVSKQIYGKDDLLSLLLSTEYIRYSTTQGTNALVELKGPRLGLVLAGSLRAQALQPDAKHQALFAALVGDRVAHIDLEQSADAMEMEITRAVTRLGSEGANRVVVAVGGEGRDSELRLKRLLLRKFPPHLLGAIPLLYSHEVVQDSDDVRRSWTALFNAFLHPAMERFLYNSEHKLRDYRTKNPLLIFRNDGGSARVAKTIALKTYSSGPRGGAEGAKALAGHYGFPRLVSMDVGGTTTDIGLVERNDVRTDRRGQVENVPISFPLLNVHSVGVGGSSIISVVNGALKVGPESVGGAPGPACFGLGGREATITDAFLLMGLLDPASYFGGEMRIDAERARAAIGEKVAQPLGIDEATAAQRMEDAWVAKIAHNVKAYTRVQRDTVLAAFGGAGPFVVCKVAEAVGIQRVIIPKLAAVFSAFGIGFSDISHQYDLQLPEISDAALEAARTALLARAGRGIYAEGFALSDCHTAFKLQATLADGSEKEFPVKGKKIPAKVPRDAQVSLGITVTRRIPHTTLSGAFGEGSTPAVAGGKRRLQSQPGHHHEVPLYRVEEQPAGASGQGPAVLEESFFTCRIDAGWSFEINAAGDILLTHHS